MQLERLPSVEGVVFELRCTVVFGRSYVVPGMSQLRDVLAGGSFVVFVYVSEACVKASKRNAEPGSVFDCNTKQRWDY